MFDLDTLVETIVQLRAAKDSQDNRKNSLPVRVNLIFGNFVQLC
jgi:hypothetical protein